jgi:hypothetical protein
MTMRLTNPNDGDDLTTIEVMETSSAPTLSALEELAIERQMYLDDQTSHVEAGEFCGLPSVRRTTRGSLTLFHKTAVVVDDHLVVGLSDGEWKAGAGIVWKLAEQGDDAIAPVPLDGIETVAGPRRPVATGRAEHRLRGFGVSFPEAWLCAFAGVRGESNEGPWRRSPWGDDERAPGHQLRWGITGYLPDVQSDIRQLRKRFGVADDAHGMALTTPLFQGTLRFSDYIAISRPAIEYPKIAVPGPDDEDVLIDDERDEYAHWEIAAWCKLGASGGFRIWLRVEQEALEGWETAWSALVSAVNIEGG